MDEWILVRETIPKEIREFFNNVFELYEIRGRVGNKNGITFYIRSKEKNHVVPHVHAKYGDYEVSISINDSKVLIGNLPQKNLALAQKWVSENKDLLFNCWDDIAISAISSLTNSRIGVKE